MKSFMYTSPVLSKFLMLLFFVAVATALQAQATLSVQGVLTRSDGTAVDDGQYPITFRLWKSESGTSAAEKVHEETVSQVETTGGVYSVVLGMNGTPINAPFDQIYYLGVSVNGGTELTPRPVLTHAPYALSLLGQNNKFPSTGPVIADAIRAKGGPATGGTGANANGFAFKPGGDESGGMYSEGANNIQLWAGSAKKIQLSNTLNELYGQTNTNDLTVFGALTSNDHTINGNLSISGHVNGNLDVTGNTLTFNRFLTRKMSQGGGYSFDYDGAYDSGMFGEFDGGFGLYSNGGIRLEIGSNGTNYLHGNTVIYNSLIADNQVFLNNVPDFDGKNMQWNATTHLVGADNSTRRAKFNIKTLEDDFSLILQAQPRTYTRKVDPNHWEVGYIAEEMDSLGLKKLVEYDELGRPDGYNYEKMILYVTEVLKMQHNDIANLQAEIAALKSENNNLRTENTGLRSDNSNLINDQKAFSAQLNELSRRMLSLESAGTGKK